MLSVAIHKDIAEYQPKVIGKLTGRTLISITVALGLSVAVAVYMNLVLKIDPTDHLEFIYAVSLPCWCCGFWKPHGLPFEQFALLWLPSIKTQGGTPYERNASPRPFNPRRIEAVRGLDR